MTSFFFFFNSSHLPWICLIAGKHQGTFWICQTPGMNASGRSFTSWLMETSSLLRSKASERWSFHQVTWHSLSHTWQTHRLSAQGRQWSDLISDWQQPCCCFCSNSERFEKEGHCPSHTDSNSRNPHSVSTVNGHWLFYTDCTSYIVLKSRVIARLMTLFSVVFQVETWLA